MHKAAARRERSGQKLPDTVRYFHFLSRRSRPGLKHARLFRRHGPPGFRTRPVEVRETVRDKTAGQPPTGKSPAGVRPAAPMTGHALARFAGHREKRRWPVARVCTYSAWLCQWIRCDRRLHHPARTAPPGRLATPSRHLRRPFTGAFTDARGGAPVRCAGGAGQWRTRVPLFAGWGGRDRRGAGVRVSSAARAGLPAEWDRCRWVWKECVARSRKAHADGEKCGPALPDRMLTRARAVVPWPAEGSSVPQQQLIGDFGTSRAKALKDTGQRLAVHRRAGMPKHKKKREALPTPNCTRRGFRLKDGRLHLAGGIVLAVVWSRELPAGPSSAGVHRDSTGHWYASFVVPVLTGPLLRTGRAWCIPRTPSWTADRAEREPGTHCRCRNAPAPAPVPAPCAKRCPPGTRTPRV